MSLSNPRRRPNKPLLVQLIEMRDWDPIVAEYSSELCTRCQDGFLRVDAALDGRDVDGTRVCSGCTWTTDLRSAA